MGCCESVSENNNLLINYYYRIYVEETEKKQIYLEKMIIY